jgi:hypothetical protein
MRTKDSTRSFNLPQEKIHEEKIHQHQSLRKALSSLRGIHVLKRSIIVPAPLDADNLTPLPKTS